MTYLFAVSGTGFQYATTAGDLSAATTMEDSINREGWVYFDSTPTATTLPHYYMEGGVSDGYGWFYDFNGTYSPSTGSSSYTYWNGFFCAETFPNGTMDEQDLYQYGPEYPTGSHTFETRNDGSGLWNFYVDGLPACDTNGVYSYTGFLGTQGGIEVGDTTDQFANGSTESNLDSRFQRRI